MHHVNRRALTLALQVDTQVPIEVEGILPETLAGKSLGDIERLPIYHGNRVEQLAKFFSCRAKRAVALYHGELVALGRGQLLLPAA